MMPIRNPHGLSPLLLRRNHLIGAQNIAGLFHLSLLTVLLQVQRARRYRFQSPAVPNRHSAPRCPLAAPLQTQPTGFSRVPSYIMRSCVGSWVVERSRVPLAASAATSIGLTASQR